MTYERTVETNYRYGSVIGTREIRSNQNVYKNLGYGHCGHLKLSHNVFDLYSHSLNLLSVESIQFTIGNIRLFRYGEDGYL